MSIKVKSAEISLTEQTLKEIMTAIKEFKEENGTDFIDDPMPEGRRTDRDLYLEQRRRGIIKITSAFSGDVFVVALETKPNTQESLGFHLAQE